MSERRNQTAVGPSAKSRVVDYLDVGELEFDLRNPRYGAAAKTINTEIEALDHIVSQFGVDDVLSSISVNGFFDSEPLVGLRMKPNEKVKIVEGNRRLAATLILLNDTRAKNQSNLIKKFRESPLVAEDGLSKIPVIVYEGSAGAKEVLPYIGVRHIVGFLEWDSYAKADWVDRVLKENSMTLVAISEMLGDKNGTIKRMLAGYRFVNQAIKIGEFRPDQSQRKGRGSNPEYPFSWIYTALDNKPIKDYIGLLESTDGTPADEPIPTEKYDEAGWLLKFLFGDRVTGLAAVVEDSREIGELAKLILNPKAYSRLKEGVKVRAVVKESRPSTERLQDGLFSIESELRELAGLIAPGQVLEREAMQLLDPARSVAGISRKIFQDLKTISMGEEAIDDI